MAKATEARCLLDHDGHKINSVLTGADAERAIAEGWGDGDAAAVKYAKSIAPKDEAPADEPAAEESDAE